MIRAADALAALRALPIRPLATLLSAGPLLVLAPHPDDESLGCGGLIAASCAAGLPPFVLVLTDGAGSHPRSHAYPPERLRAVRQQEAREAVKALGLPDDRIGFLGLPDTLSPTEGQAFASAVAAVVDCVRRYRIGTILATWAHDPHCDHGSAHGIAVAAAAATGTRRWAYPVWGWTLPADALIDDKVPTGCRIDISPYLAMKRRAIAAHRSQYAGLIQDDPAGFQLPPDFLAYFESRYETVLDIG